MNSPPALVSEQADVDQTAAGHLSTNVPVCAPHDSVGEVRERLLRADRFDSAVDVVVLDRGLLVGLIRIEDLLAAPPDAPVELVADLDPAVVAPGADQEVVAWKAVAHGQGSLAVVDGRGRFLGLIPSWRMLGVLLHEHDEDLARLSGYLRQTAAVRSASDEPVLLRFWHRMPWLLVGLLAAMLAAAIVGGFEADLEGDLSLAFFIPGIVYMADAVGTQTETLVVRGLSVGVPIASVIRREVATGIAIGAVLAAVALPLALLWGDGAVAVTVALAIWAACSVATAIALVLPWAISASGRDPAYGSGPLATVAQDLLSLLIYFGIATLIVG